MRNLTITIDEKILQKARIKALEQGTSVNAILREYLESYAGVNTVEENAMKDLIKLSKNSKSSRGKAKWSRDEIHER
ncbi:MAG: DUF6364 family protein [Thermodesulfobacteriota bacterium]